MAKNLKKNKKKLDFSRYMWNRCIIAIWPYPASCYNTLAHIAHFIPGYPWDASSKWKTGQKLIAKS